MTYIPNFLDVFLGTLSKYDKKRIRQSARFEKALDLGTATMYIGEWKDSSWSNMALQIKIDGYVNSWYYIRGLSVRETMRPDKFNPQGTAFTMTLRELLEDISGGVYKDDIEPCIFERFVCAVRENIYCYLYLTHKEDRSDGFYPFGAWLKDLPRVKKMVVEPVNLGAETAGAGKIEVPLDKCEVND